MSGFTKWASKHSDWGSLFLRLVLGFVFITHGLGKFRNMGGTSSFFGSLGLPAFVAYLVMALELFGGALIILGLFTRYIAGLAAIDMFFAIVLAKLPHGASYELELSLLAMGLALVFLGPGKWYLDKALFKKEL